eukprot:6099987-Amphidinium_carterae.1
MVPVHHMMRTMLDHDIFDARRACHFPRHPQQAQHAIPIASGLSGRHAPCKATQVSTCQQKARGKHGLDKEVLTGFAQRLAGFHQWNRVSMENQTRPN